MKNFKMFILLLVATVGFVACGQNNKVVESYYDNGNPMQERYFEIIDGNKVLTKEVIYYDNKVKKMEGAYKDSLRDGVWKAWHRDGSLWSEGNFVEGKRDGFGNTYYQNGARNIEGWYKDDKRVGKWNFYDSLGNLEKTVDFDKY